MGMEARACSFPGLQERDLMNTGELWLICDMYGILRLVTQRIKNLCHAQSGTLWMLLFWSHLMKLKVNFLDVGLKAHSSCDFPKFLRLHACNSQMDTVLYEVVHRGGSDLLLNVLWLSTHTR